ncbi:MAG: Uma2 family endonuclease [Acidimicrobiales bacterium]
MAEEALATELPIEAPGMTATEAHVRTVALLRAALSRALRGVAGVFGEIFLRVDDRVAVSPDVFAVPGVTAGDRTVYRVPAEPTPSVTIEVLSPKNRAPSGLAELGAKRALFGRIGVPLHLEVDREEGFIAVWELRGDTLVRTDLGTDYSSEAIGGARIETPAPGALRVTLRNGHEVLDGGDELARAERLAARLRALGVDPVE